VVLLGGRLKRLDVLVQLGDLAALVLQAISELRVLALDGGLLLFEVGHARLHLGVVRCLAVELALDDRNLRRVHEVALNDLPLLFPPGLALSQTKP